jgi:hypothetical protein
MPTEAISDVAMLPLPPPEEVRATPVPVIEDCDRSTVRNVVLHVRPHQHAEDDDNVVVIVVPSCHRHEDGGKGGGKCQSVCLPCTISVGIGRGKFGKKSELSPGKVWSARVKCQMIRKL